MFCAPAGLLELGEAIFGGVGTWVPEVGALEGVGEVLLRDEVAGVVMSIFVVGAVAHLFHQRCRGIAYMKGHWEVAGLAHFGEGGVDGAVGGVALG